MSRVTSRREFLRRAAAAGTALAAGPTLAPRFAPAGEPRPGEKLRLAILGVAARGGENLEGLQGEEIVALCDIDEQRLAAAARAFPQAKTYVDYRELLDRERDVQAVAISTPDHTHALPTLLALDRGLDVYCEKPLAHSVWEVRQVREAAARRRAVTQMGTQIHAGDNYRRVVELVQSGILGPIDRVYVWQGNTVKPGRRATSGEPPAHVHYDLWTGPAPLRPYDPAHFHFNWRYWWDYGGGILADMGCHYIDLPYWALGLRHPRAVTAQGQKTSPGDNDVPDLLRVDWEFDRSDRRPPLTLTWYHGGWMPEGAETYQTTAAVLFEGERGRLLADYGTHKVFLNDGARFETPPPSIPRSAGHHQEWIDACKHRGPTTCNFDYSGALAETVLLGNVAYRVGPRRLEWDAAKLEFIDCPEARPLVRRAYRSGWELPLVS